MVQICQSCSMPIDQDEYKGTNKDDTLNDEYCKWKKYQNVIFMTKITKCLNDWNATIEALGNKEQTILLRKTSTTQKEFLLYPTVSYAKKNNVLDLFKGKYQDFVKNNLLP